MRTVRAVCDETGCPMWGSMSSRRMNGILAFEDTTETPAQGKASGHTPWRKNGTSIHSLDIELR